MVTFRTNRPSSGGFKKPFFRGRGPVKKEAEHRINEHIKSPKLRLVGDNVEQGIYSTSEAQQLATELGLDLVEISPGSEPPVAKIMDYQKFLYEKKKKEKEIKAKSVKQTVKEIRFGPNTNEHDFNFKVKHGISFLKEGAKVKA
ncbi:MAG: translation initiation factor IF-3, partial [Bacteroidia bacterium]|nr:translation initiation factor IF-3 [Bacteroidia bacterium]